MPEIYVSTDVETNGPIPGIYSMLSLGSAAYTENKRLVATFETNLNLLPKAQEDPDTMKWWATQSTAWDNHRRNLEDPEPAMKRYVAWLKELPGTPIFVGYPTGFDFMFVYWYLIRFAGESPFSLSALDIKSYVMAVLKTDLSEISKSNMPGKWFDKLPHTHVALDDALEQGALFCNILMENKGKACSESLTTSYVATLFV